MENRMNNIEHNSGGFSPDDAVQDRIVSILAGFVPQAGDEEEGKRSYAAFIRKRKMQGRKHKIFAVMKYAAAIIAGIGIATAAFHFRYSADDGDLMNTVCAPTGQHVSLILSDGTKVWLNAESRLEYPALFGRKARTVKLSGEAYFDVARSDAKPFTVSTARFDVMALGTRFNVCSYSDSCFHLVLEHGSVKAWPSGMEESGVILMPGEEAVPEEGILSVRPCSDISHSLWRDGIYSFNSEPLGNIFRTLKRYYGITINVRDSSLLSTEYTAKFRHKDGLDEILRQIGKTHKFSVCKDIGKNTITIY
jgi:ferric-dicitrate binding protein FerR (iron transport regulator)